jgi:hypothetical protein
VAALDKKRKGILTDNPARGEVDFPLGKLWCQKGKQRLDFHHSPKEIQALESRASIQELVLV